MHRRAPFVLVLVAFLAFVSLGLPDGTLGVAWPSMAASFDVPLARLGALLTAFMFGYLSASLSGGWLLRRVGIAWLLVGSIGLTAASSLGYSLVHWWPLLVALSAVLGVGSGAIDTGTNAFAASSFSPSTINWLHACYGIGASTGPLLMGHVLASGQSWRVGYGIQGGLLAGLALLLVALRRRWATAAAPGGHALTAGIGEALASPAVWGNVLLFFLYVGSEVSIGQWSFSVLRFARDWSVEDAGNAVAGYWGSLTAGRFIFGAAARRLSATTILRIGLALAPLGLALFWIADGQAATFAGLALCGFGFAPIFPCLIAETPIRVGRELSDHSVSLQVSAACLGIGLIPSLMGLLLDRAGFEILAPAVIGLVLALAALHEAQLAVFKPHARQTAP